MIVSSKHLTNKPKIYFSHGLLPKYVDQEQLPWKDKPWSAILRHQWASKVELVLDEKLYDQISGKLTEGLDKVSWSKAVLPLSDLLQDDFFNTYIKRGNISMLSQGRPGLDPLYTLHEGLLRLELPKELYERCGLVGHAIPDGGRKHIKSRFAVEINLRQASMVHGKRGFERIVWASKNVLSEPVKWLFHDHWPSQTLESGSIPISLHEPANKECRPVVSHLKDVLVPDMRSWSEEPDRDSDDAVALLDWLGMVAMGSPRISVSDSIDPFLACYEVPGRETAATSNLVRICWHGFVQSQWIRQLLYKCMMATKKTPEAWYAISVKTLCRHPKEPRDGYTILRTQLKDAAADHTLVRPEFIMWELDSCIDG